jgi:GNAT superfamily N-acetyltransferase
MMCISRATPDDLDTLIRFRDQAAAWLTSHGIDQGQEPWPTEDLMVEGMLRNIEAGETFIVWDDDNTPAATITINRFAKAELWTEQERAEPALYAYKVTVDRAYGGQGLGAELLDWAGTKAADEGPTGCGWTCGRPTSASSTTTCARASPTSAPSCSRTTPPARCSSAQRNTSQRRAFKTWRA